MKYKSIFDATVDYPGPSGPYPTRSTSLLSSEKSIVGAIFNRLAIDVSNGKFIHASVGPNGVLNDIPDSFLNRAFRNGPNENQNGQDFIMDIVLTMCNDGCACIVVTKREDTKPTALQVGTPVGFYADYIKVRLFNNEKQSYEDVLCKKGVDVAPVTNPYYSVMNDSCQAVRRLMAKLNNIDMYSKDVTGGKMNGVITVPHDVSLEQGKKYAKGIIQSIDYLQNYIYNKYGFMVLGSQCDVKFPGKSIDPKVFDEVKELEDEVYAQLGIPKEVFLGTAKEEQIRAYQAGTIEQFWKSITSSLRKTFLHDRQEEDIVVTRDMFSGVTGQNIGDMADKLARNSVINPNELRGRLGLVASDQPIADSLYNKNMPLQDQEYNIFETR